MVDAPATAGTVRSNVPGRRRAIGIGLTALGVAVALTVAIVMLALPPVSHLGARSQPQRHAVAHIRRTSRLSAADWITVKNAIRLRTMALAPGRTALYRSFAAYMALSGLRSLHQVLRGRCAVAVSYLYNNLLDLHHAHSGEDWGPLLRLIREQPPLSVCAPRAVARVTYVA